MDKKESVEILTPIEEVEPPIEQEQNDEAAEAILRELQQEELRKKKNHMVKVITKLQHDYKTTKMENSLFITYLKEYNPDCLQGFEKIPDISISNQQQKIEPKIVRSTYLSMHTIPTQMSLTEQQLVSIPQKFDIVLKNIEARQAKIEELDHNFQKRSSQMVAEVEELKIRIKMIEDLIDDFEMVVESCDEFGIPMEKFHHFMTSRSKRMKNIVDKLRLHTGSMKVHYAIIANLYTQKKLVGENLQRVDFEQLEIENLNLKTQIEAQTKLYMNLKIMSCNGNLKVSQHMEKLNQKIMETDRIKADIMEKEAYIEKTGQELERACNEIDVATKEYVKLAARVQKYEVPDTMQYVKAKAHLRHLQKQLKVLQRQTGLQHLAISSKLSQIKNVTGLSHVSEILLS